MCGVDVLMLRFICRYTDEHGYAPSQREIAEASGRSVGSVPGDLRDLAEMGYLRRSDGKPRALSVTEVGRRLVDEAMA